MHHLEHWHLGLCDVHRDTYSVKQVLFHRRVKRQSRNIGASKRKSPQNLHRHVPGTLRLHRRVSEPRHLWRQMLGPRPLCRQSVEHRTRRRATLRHGQLARISAGLNRPDTDYQLWYAASTFHATDDLAEAFRPSVIGFDLTCTQGEVRFGADAGAAVEEHRCASPAATIVQRHYSGRGITYIDATLSWASARTGVECAQAVAEARTGLRSDIKAGAGAPPLANARAEDPSGTRAGARESPNITSKA
ncbi:hypothetical protein FVE85_6977 [Porphyridium purpureum]|uniref:Uncharacterized protein n=1 Tax=Porphyridium purpureum TaxID=35688 RepID=A0A5J4Z8L6_PORPP|nr:hypothetical protein FVE85_6977 [Porphyridium purpureum]|eukprot:POR7466..scf295_1